MTLHRRERPEAAAELDAAIDWYADKHSRLAMEFLEAIEAALSHISLWPDSARPYPGSPDVEPLVRVKRVRGFPYTIAYLVDGDDLVILAYAHERRHPGYWTDRSDD